MTTHRRSRSTDRRLVRVVIWSTSIVLGVVILSGLWLGVKAFEVRAALNAVIPLSSQLQKQVASGDVRAATQSAHRLTALAKSATAATGDPLWRICERAPALGQNLLAIRTIAAAVDDLARNVVTPLTGASEHLNISMFHLHSGGLDLAPLVALAPVITRAAVSLHNTQSAVEKIDTTGTISQITAAKKKLETALASASTKVDAVNRTVLLLPSMLGSAGPRNYLLLIQNPAELRALGGIPGAIAQLHVENGHVELTGQSSTTAYPGYKTPVVPLAADTENLYGDLVGRYLQNVTLTPRFDQSAVVAREMWRLNTGVTVDGVIAIDPVALSYLLSAAGPVKLATGEVIDSGNAVKMLLSDVYRKYSLPTQQDAFFASAAKTIFTAVQSESINPELLVKSLVRAGDEHRLLIWSAEPAEQKLLAETTVAGGLPQSDDQTRRFGVYLNDASGAKMDYYLSVQLGAGRAVCQTDKRPSYAIDVTLANTAPADATTTLPEYVTGGNKFGVPSGSVRTNVNIYAPLGVQGLKATRDGTALPYSLGFDGGQQVAMVQVELRPGQQTTLRFNYLSKAPSDSRVAVVSTPTIVINPTAPIAVVC